MIRYRAHVGRSLTKAVAIAMTFGLVAAACGGNSGTKNGNGTQTTLGVSGLKNDTNLKPVYGGSATFALEADTTGGWCLPEAQLAISGIQVASAIYDTLTVPDNKGGYVGSLASSVVPTAGSNFTQWTINLRQGITFQDGTPFNATVVKNNLDAYRGQYAKKGPNGQPLRNPLLFVFVFENVKSITTSGNYTVVVNMKKPWSTFPSHLYQYGRLGIMAQSQLDSPNHCFDHMVGTGPFEFKGDWVPNNHLTVVKNPHYWRKDKNGQPLPYLNSITFKTVLETNSLISGMESGAIDLADTDNTLAIKPFEDDAKAGKMSILATDKDTEISYTLLNDQTEPFNNILAREAFAYAFDRTAYNNERQNGLLQQASGPFAPGVLGYLPASGTNLPSYNLTKAKQLVQEYTAQTHKPLKFEYGTTNDSDSLKSAQVLVNMLQKAGMQVTIRSIDQSQYINAAVQGQFQAQAWRNHPGFDPDDQYVWWHCDNAAPNPEPATFPTSAACNNLVNFSKFNDSVINTSLDNGRSSTDPTARKNDYETLNKEFAKQLWELWGYYVLWSVPSQNNVHGIDNLKLPTATSVNAVGNSPFEGLASGIDVAGLWKSK